MMERRIEEGRMGGRKYGRREVGSKEGRWEERKEERKINRKKAEMIKIQDSFQQVRTEH